MKQILLQFIEFQKGSCQRSLQFTWNIFKNTQLQFYTIEILNSVCSSHEKKEDNDKYKFQQQYYHRNSQCNKKCLQHIIELDNIFTSTQINNYKQQAISKWSCQISNHEIENRFNYIKDTLNFNLCSQSNLVKVIKDIQQLKTLHPKMQNCSLNYDKMMFKTILQEQENGQYHQLFSEFDYLNEILDKEEIILNIQHLEIDYLFDERLETYYTFQANYEQIAKTENNTQQYQVQQQQNQQLLTKDEQKKAEQKKQLTENKLPPICIHKQLFVQFIQLYNYNFQAFEFEQSSNLKYTQALMVQNQPYITNSNKSQFVNA
ncbi:hypothetical protein ABPG72_021131 [Tetrahymena utriculariae]